MGPSSKARIPSPLTFSLCTVLGLAVGCGAHDTKDAEIIGQSESALVFTYFNSAQGHVVTGNPFGVNALAGSTVLDTTDLGAGNAFGCRDCSTTGWQDTQANASQNALSTVAAARSRGLRRAVGPGEEGGRPAARGGRHAPRVLARGRPRLPVARSIGRDALGR